MKNILWIVFIGLLFVISSQCNVLNRSGYGIIDLELSKTEQGIHILQGWQSEHYGDQTLLEVARVSTRWDFAFIVSYVSLFITLSNWQMQRERYIVQNELLRFNFLIVFVAGVLDIIENYRILHNFHHIDNLSEYLGTRWLSLVKFILLGFAFLNFIISFIKSFFKQSLSA